MLQKESSFIDVDDVRNWNTSHAKRGGVRPIIFTQGHVPWQECKISHRRSGLPLQSKKFLRTMYLRELENGSFMGSTLNKYTLHSAIVALGKTHR
jgi:hypothetical protein